MRNALVVAQVALSFVALIGAGLFSAQPRPGARHRSGIRCRSSRRAVIQSHDTGHAARSRHRREQPDSRSRARRRWRRAAAYASTTPLLPAGSRGACFSRGRSHRPACRAARSDEQCRRRIPGDHRDPAGPRSRLYARDSAQAPRVVIINETMARLFWPDQEAIGKRFRFFRDEF